MQTVTTRCTHTQKKTSHETKYLFRGSLHRGGTFPGTDSSISKHLQWNPVGSLGYWAASYVTASLVGKKTVVLHSNSVFIAVHINIGSCLTIIWILFPLWREAAGERWKYLKGQKRCCLLINSKEALWCCPCLENVTRHSCCLKGLQAFSIITFIIIRVEKIKRILNWYVRRYTFSAVSVWMSRWTWWRCWT